MFIGDLWKITDEIPGEQEQKRGFKLAKKGARLGCNHCQRVMSYSLSSGYCCWKDAARELREGPGRRYGQHMLDDFNYRDRGGLQDYAQAAVYYGLAANVQKRQIAFR